MASTSSATKQTGRNVKKDEHKIWLLANRGIKMLLNNQTKEAEDLFLEYPDNLVMFAGHSFVIFMDALMSFDEDKLDLAISTLREVEERCTVDNGWIKTFHNFFANTDCNTSAPQSLADQLETQIILADSQVCLATLIFLRNDISGYLKGAWVLRKAWKVYQRTYKDILGLYKQMIGELHLPDPMQTPNEQTPYKESEWDIPEIQTTNGKQEIDKRTIVRLMGAVSFGYGLFQLGVSLLPLSLTKLISILGFAATREHGLQCLMYARLGVDMRAPLATLGLLWYHTIVRPYYAFDGTNVQAGLDSAFFLLKESEHEFGQSALFLFFKGRAYRLNSQIPSALKSYQMAVENATQREIKLLALHEVGWCHLIELDFINAETIFVYLKNASRWSRAFYGYLAAICTGAFRSRDQWVLLDAVKTNLKNHKKVAQLDVYLTNRLKCCPSRIEELDKIKNIFWKLLIFEMLYLWNALASCSKENIQKIINECQSKETSSDEPMLGLSKLIIGACYSIQKKIKRSINSFRECLEERRNIPKDSFDAHVSAFAQFELGNLLVKREETKAEGKVLLQNVTLYTGYDFEAKLNVRIHYILKNT